MCSGGMSSSSLVLGAYLCGCPHAALYHVRHLIFSFTSRFTSVSILIHTVDKVDSFSTEHSKNTFVDTSVKQTRRVCPCLPLLPWLSIRQTLLLDRHFVPVPKLSVKERGGTVHVLVLINIEPPDHSNTDYNTCRVGRFRGVVQGDFAPLLCVEFCGSIGTSVITLLLAKV